MNISVPKEKPQETRVALVPETVARLTKIGLEVRVETGAGLKASFTDEAYLKAGAQIVSGPKELWSEAEILVKVGLPQSQEFSGMTANAVFIGFLQPLANPELVKQLAKHPLTGLSMEMIPRISRAQSMDALSSQANIAGYKAVLIAAEKLGKFFPMLTTAAGTVVPAKLLVIGVGVAGLQAIATARRLGAVVEAYDIRPEVKEQVQSLGAKFVEANIDESGSGEGGYAKEVSEETKKKLQEALADRVAASDVVITTAQVPGKKAPRLVTEAMVRRMHPGSIVIDMASEQGGNVALSKPGETVDVNGIQLLGPVNLPGSVPIHASQFYAKNIFNLLQLITKEGKLHLDLSDEIINGACVCHQGELRK